MKRAISLVLLLILVGVQAPSALAAGTGYDDVPAKAWYVGAMDYVPEKDLMSGAGSGKFFPDIPMTRAMLAAILYRNRGQPSVVDSSAFSDVQDSCTPAEKGEPVQSTLIGKLGPNFDLSLSISAARHLRKLKK